MAEKQDLKNNTIWLIILFFVFLIINVSFKNQEVDISSLLSISNRNFTERKMLSSLDIKATSFIVYDVNKKEVVAGKNIDAEHPLASLNKIFAIYTFEKYRGETPVLTISENALSVYGDYGFDIDDQINLDEAYRALLVASSNDVAEAAQEELKQNTNQDLVELMNTTAKDLGLEKTYFINPSGLDEDDGIAGGYSSAREYALFLDIFFNEYPLIAANTLTVKDEIKILNKDKYIELENTFKDLRNVPGINFVKTGFTDLAGGNLAVIINKGLSQKYIIIVLGSTINERFSDVEKIANFIVKTNDL